MEFGKTAISSSSYSSSLSKRPTARLVGPETMIHSPNCFAIPCAGHFHKINTGYEATTTTVNSSCLMHCLLLRHHFTKLTLDKGAALPHVRMRVAAFRREPLKICGTSGKIIHEYGCRDAPCEKSWKQGYPLSNTIKDTSTIMRNPSLHNSGKGLRMIVLVSLIVLLRGYPCFHDFSHGASLYPYSFN